MKIDKEILIQIGRSRKLKGSFPSDRTPPLGLLRIQMAGINENVESLLDDMTLYYVMQDAIQDVKSNKILDHYQIRVLKFWNDESMAMVADVLQYLNSDIYPIYTKETCEYFYSGLKVPPDMIDEISGYMFYITEVNRLAKDKDIDQMCKKKRKEYNLEDYEASNVYIISSIMHEYICRINDERCEEELIE